MSGYTCLELLKSKAKKQARINGIKQTEALENIAKQAKFSSYHELSEVAKREPLEPRLVLAAMGETSLEEIIYRDEVFTAIEQEVDDKLSGDIADTNAYGFTVENLDAVEVVYDDKRGVLSVKATFEYQGEQDPDRAYSGTSFDVEATMELLLRDDEWSLVEDSFELISVESDTDRESHYRDYMDE